jgi:hypothetical protein
MSSCHSRQHQCELLVQTPTATVRALGPDTDSISANILVQASTPTVRISVCVCVSVCVSVCCLSVCLSVFASKVELALFLTA